MKRAGPPFLAVAAAAAIIALLVYGVASKSDANRTLDDKVANGQLPRAPDRRMPVLGAQGTRTLADYRGKVVVLNFWASWCYPACYEEAPVLERGWQAWRDRQVVVLGIDIQDTDDKALKFVRDFRLSFPNAPDPAGKVSIDYGIYGVPETFFIDKQGRIRAKHVGSLTEDVFRKHVERLTAEGS